MSRRAELAATALIGAALVAVAAGATALGAAGRVFVRPVVIEASSPAQAYAAWKAAGIRGRILVHLDRRLVTDAVPLSHGIEDLDPRVDDGNFVVAGILSGRVREIFHVVPDAAWDDVRANLARRARTSALVVADGPRFRTAIRSVPVTITRLRDLPPLRERVLVDLNTALWPPAALAGLEADVTVTYRRDPT